jgi:hypothetical protein
VSVIALSTCRVCGVFLRAGEPEVHNLFFYDARSAMGTVEAITV